MNKVYIITGPTATGKTRFATRLAKKYNGELINADSRQIYKYLDIITGKDRDDIGSIPVHLYDFISPEKPFSSHAWTAQAWKVIDLLKKHGKTPILVGGTYLYISHLLYGIDTEGIRPNNKLRQELGKRDLSYLQRLLQKDSPVIWKNLNESDQKNPQRLIRKIEIAKSKQGKKKQSRRLVDEFEVEMIGLSYKKGESLRQAIKKRVEKRLKEGAIEELKSALQKGFKLTDPGLQANACREINEYVQRSISKQRLIELWVTLEMQYAKRQFTFMKTNKDIRWSLISAY